MESNKKEQTEKTLEEKILDFLEYVYDHTSKGYVLSNKLSKIENSTLPKYFKISSKHTLDFLRKFGIIEFEKYKKRRVCTWVSNETPEKIYKKYLEFYRDEQREYDKKRKIKLENEKNKNQIKIPYNNEVPTTFSKENDELIIKLNKTNNCDGLELKNNKKTISELLIEINNNLVKLNNNLEKIDVMSFKENY